MENSRAQYALIETKQGDTKAPFCEKSVDLSAVSELEEYVFSYCFASKPEIQMMMRDLVGVLT
jgi:hypothetical protein